MNDTQNENHNEKKCGPWCRHEELQETIRGEWHNEPNRVEFKHAGFECLIHRAPLGHLCGYVAVPPGHPAYQRDYNDLGDIEVHGGVNYASECQGAICHVPAPGEPENVWWLGFDCAHAGDIVPTMLPFLFHNDHYRDLDYVRHETESLAEQLRRMQMADEFAEASNRG